MKQMRPFQSFPFRRMAAALALVTMLAGCQVDELGYGPKAQRPVSQEIVTKMKARDMSATSPIMIRIFKEESALEVWKQKRNGRYELLEEFEICKWSGDLGPKFKEGDRQAPEGFYEITPGLMNPNSNYHLAFNLGYPNAYDRSHGRTGSHLMVHGACSSRGCYAMTDEQVQDIYALARDSFKGGQRSFQVQAFPFRMTAENMARHRDSEHLEFWNMLKVGYDHFELTKVPPKVDVCEKKYVFDATPVLANVPFQASAKCPTYEVPQALASLLAEKQSKDEETYQELVAKLEAREERQKRRAERETAIARAFGGGQPATEATATASTETSVAATTAPAPGQIAVPGPTATGQSPIQAPTASPVATAFAAQPSAASGNTPTGFLKKFLPFGAGASAAEPEAQLTVDPATLTGVPESKPQ